jgi:phospholipid transport system substrate-binding protein
MITRRTTLLTLTALPALTGAGRAFAQAGDPSAPIQVLNNALLQIMQAGRTASFPQRFQMLAPAVDQAFDLPQILQTSVGLRWNELPQNQKAQLAGVFREYTIASYVANFDSYDGQRFQILPQRRQVGRDTVVETELVPRSGSPTRLDYVMRQTGRGWQVIDVLADGSISRVAVQRSDWRTLLSSGNATRLIQTLQQKVASLSGGTMRS